MNINRRQFITDSIKTASLMAAPSLLYSCASGKRKTDAVSIDAIELYRYDINIPRHFSWGTWYNRQQVFMKITAGDYYGWSEVAGSTNNPDLDLSEWGGFLGQFKGVEIVEAYKIIKNNQTNDGKLDRDIMEFIEMALLDILGKIEEKPAIEFLGLKGSAPVSGLYCVLEKDMEKVKENTHKCIEQSLNTHVKYKMYGDESIDQEIVKVARSILGEDAFILSDANRGYKDWQSLDELAEILGRLHTVGLNAMEDPAELTNAQWKALQDKVSGLDLVPDYPLRPAWKGTDRITAGMGRAYNMHPESMGSFNHLPALGEKIKAIGGKIMIGDASLVGPACNAWQQTAIGLGAAWVEAVEKAEDSANYLECLISKPTYRDSEGKFACDLQPGFGVELDEVLLKDVCAQKVNI